MDLATILPVRASGFRPRLVDVDEPEVITVDAGPVALHARHRPGGAAHPVLLVHGLSSNARLWDGVSEHLAAAGHPVVAVDLRGHGASADVPMSIKA